MSIQHDSMVALSTQTQNRLHVDSPLDHRCNASTSTEIETYDTEMTDLQQCTITH